MPASFRQYRVKTFRLGSQQVPPRVNYSHPLARWLKHAYVFSVGYGAYDAVTGKFTGVTEGTYMSNGYDGQYSGVKRTGGSSAGLGNIVLPGSVIAPPLTIVSHFKHVYNLAGARALLDDDDGISRAFQYRVDGSTANNSYLNFIYFNTAISNFSSGTSAGSIKEGIVQVGCGRVLADGTLDVFLDGKKGTTGYITGTPATTNSTFMAFNRKGGTPAPYGGDIYLELVFNTGLSDEQIAQISSNPWQVLEPSTNYAYNKFKEGQGQTTRSSWMLGSSASVDVDSRYNTLPTSSSFQPQIISEIDWSKPISKGLVFATEGSVPRYDFVTNTFGNTIGSGVSFDSGPSGKQVSFSGAVADGAYSFGNRTDLSGATEATWDILVKFNSGDPHFFGQWDTNQGWLLQKSGTSLIWVAADDNSGNRRRWGCVVFPGAGTYRIIASWQGGANICLYVNGVDKTSSAVVVNNVATSIGTTMDNLQLGTVNGGVDLNGSIVFARIWNRGLSNAECAELASAPYWKIFKTRTREIPVDNTPEKLWTPTIWTSKTRAVQPQQKVEVKNTQLSQGLISAFTGSSVFDHVRDGKKALYYNGTTAAYYGTASKSDPNYMQCYLDSSNFINIPANSNFTFVYSGVAELQGSNPGFMRSGSFTFTAGAAGTGTTFTIVNGTGMRPWIRLNGTDILQPSSGDSFSAGLPYVVAYRVNSASSAAVAWNGKVRHTAVHSTATPSFDVYGFGSQSSSGQYFGSLSGVLVYNRALTDAELVEITTNPWQVFQPTKHRIYTGI